MLQSGGEYRCGGAREAAAGGDQRGPPEVGDVHMGLKDERSSLAALDGGEGGHLREQCGYVPKWAGAEAAVVGELSGTEEASCWGFTHTAKNIPEGFQRGDTLSSPAWCLTDPAGSRGRGMMLGCHCGS